MYDAYFKVNKKTEITNMEKPVIAQKSPYVLEMQPGSYYYCTCGKSANQPFCDGSHKGSSFVPRKPTLKK